MFNTDLTNFDFNKRLDPILYPFKQIPKEKVGRIANAALPFINLYKPASPYLAIGMGSIQCYNLSSELRVHYHLRDWVAVGKHSFQIAFVISSIAITLLLPAVHVVVSGSYQIICDTYRLGCSLQQRDFQESGKALLSIGHQAIYIASTIYTAPEILLISLVAQAALELYQSYGEFKKDHWLEAAGKFLMASIRVYQAKTPGRTVHRNYLGKKLSQENIQLIYDEIKKQKAQNPDKFVDLEKILIDLYYSSKIRNISFKEAGSNLSELIFRNISFDSCYLGFVDLHSSHFDHVKFNKCDLIMTNMAHTWMQHVTINNCAARYLELSHSWLEHVLFKSSELSGSYFNNSYFKSCCFQSNQLDWANFQKSVINSCQFKENNLFFSNFSESFFNNVNFNFDILKLADFSKATLGKVKFLSCEMLHSSFYQAKIWGQFIKSNLQHVNFAEVFLNKTLFKKCDLSYATFNATKIHQTLINACQLREISFLDAKVDDGSIIKNSDLTDSMLFMEKGRFQLQNCTDNIITRPIVGLSWNFSKLGSFSGAIQNALHDNDAISLKFSHLPENIDLYALDKEVKLSIENIKQTGLQEGELSIPDAILKRATPNSELEKIKIKTAKTARYFNGMILSGGHDIEPELYGQIKEPYTHTDNDYLRSMTEFAYISQAVGTKMPVHGICRGSQMINVFFGGTLKQDVDGQNGKQKLEWNKDLDPIVAEIAFKIIGNEEMYGSSQHHQANDKMGTGLHVVLEYKGVPKFILSENGQFILTQFHPESYLLEKEDMEDDDFDDEYDKILEPVLGNNKNFFTYFMNLASNNFEASI